jgi:protein-disulfide isomerase
LSDDIEDKPVSEEKKDLPGPDDNQDKIITDEKNKPSQAKSSSNDVTVKRSTFKILVAGFVVVIIVIAFLGGYTLGMNATKPATIENSAPAQANPQPTLQATPPAPKVFVTYKDSPVRGSPDAPVTMVEFSDFQCPFCGRFYTDTLPSLEQNYIEPGKVRLVYRDFPLSNIHHNAFEAALAAQCANEQSKFWQYHDALFSSQLQWEGLDSGNVTKTFKQYAVQLGLNSTFNSCLDSGKYSGTVQKNLSDGSSYNVQGTPTFFIGNDKDGYVQVVGAQPYSVFQQAIDAQLH